MRNSTNNPTPSGKQITKAEKAFINFLNEYGAKEIVKSLRAVHDTALYHSDLSINQREKGELFDVKLLADELEKMG
jgi:phosphopantetheine adenylyltransferase